MDIFDFLEQIQQRPGMHLGEDREAWLKQLNNLSCILYGYEVALSNHRISEPGVDFTWKFMSYLRDRFGWSTSCGPVGAIRDATSTEEEAWETFWRLLAEFRASLEAAPR